MGADDGDAGDREDKTGCAEQVGANPSRFEVEAFGVGGRVRGGVGGTSPVMKESDCTTWANIIKALSEDTEWISQSLLSNTNASSDTRCTESSVSCGFRPLSVLGLGAGGGPALCSPG